MSNVRFIPARTLNDSVRQSHNRLARNLGASIQERHHYELFAGASLRCLASRKKDSLLRYVQFAVRSAKFPVPNVRESGGNDLNLFANARAASP